MNSLLRQLIRETLISERAATAQMADARNLALSIVTHSLIRKTYTLFDRNAFVRVVMDEIRKALQFVNRTNGSSKYTITDFLQQLRDNRTMRNWISENVTKRYVEFVVAGSDARLSEKSRSGKSNKAWHPSGPAAIDKYGPFLYDLIMADVGELMPDRGSVSSSARSVWKHYKDDRKDVVSTPLDNIENPQTPQETDDANVHFTGFDDFGNYLDSSYHHSGSGPDIRKLRLSHSQMLKNINLKLGLDQKDVEDILVDSTDRFFGTARRQRPRMQ